MAASRPIAFTGARLVDPATGYDGPGCLVAVDGLIVLNNAAAKSGSGH